MNENDRQFPPGYNALRRGRWSECSRAYMVTTVTENRAPVFADLLAGRFVVREMMRLENEGRVQSLAFVLMPDHLHWLLVLGENEDLSSVVGLFKGRSAREVNKCLKGRGHLWQRAFYDHALRTDEDLRKLARYIVANPIRAGIVKRFGDYPLWDAIWMDPLCA